MIQRLPADDSSPERFVISSGGCWRPGAYAMRRAAVYAFRFPDETLALLQEKANRTAGGIITSEDLKKARLKFGYGFPPEGAGL